MSRLNKVGASLTYGGALVLLIWAFSQDHKTVMAQQKGSTNTLQIDPMDNYLKDSRRMAWGQGYSTGIAVALKEYRALEERIRLGTAKPGEGTNVWQTILDGITNNPYVSK
jgi:hypothetical protein